MLISAAQLYLSFDNDQEIAWPPPSRPASSWHEPKQSLVTSPDAQARQSSRESKAAQELWKGGRQPIQTALPLVKLSLNPSTPLILKEMRNNCKERLSCASSEGAETVWYLCRCGGCGAVFHAECRQKAQPCPRCVHRELHHKRPSSFWSAEDDGFYLPYQDTWGGHKRARSAQGGHCLLFQWCGGSLWCYIRSVLACIHQPV